ncbi:MAG: OmpW family outer membrane protein [Steroidobacteraceae bacterium]
MRVTNRTATVLGLALGFAAALGMGAAHADNDVGAGDHPNTVALGLYYVTFHVHADDISGPYTPPGLNVTNPSVDTLYIAYMRRLSPHFDAELTLGAPPVTRSVGKGPALVGSVPFNGQTIATTRWLAPSLLVKYYLFSPDAMFRPYLGVGVNYTKFESRQVTAAGEAISGGPTSLSLPVSVGPVANVGVSYHPFNQVVVNLSYSASWVDTRLTTDTAGILRTSHVEFNPRALVVAVGYQF